MKCWDDDTLLNDNKSESLKLYSVLRSQSCVLPYVIYLLSSCCTMVHVAVLYGSDSLRLKRCRTVSRYNIKVAQQ